VAGHWITSWTAAPMNVWGPDAPLSGFYGQTVREIARLTLGGTHLVLRFGNEFGTKPIVLDAVHVARAAESGRVEPLTTQQVTFGGASATKIYPGAPCFSDPVEMPTGALARVAVSYYSSGFVPIATHHLEAQQTAYISVPGNFVSAEQMVVENTTTSHYLVSAIQTCSPFEARAIVCIGDSITDGFCSSVDSDRRWPDILADRIRQVPEMQNVAVLNQGIGGNRLLHSRRGELLLARLDRDVFSLRAVSHVILLEGINDIVWPNTVLAGPEEAVSAAEIIAGLHQVVARVRLAGPKILLGTITPFEGTLPQLPHGGYYTGEKERTRQLVNQWIRTQSGADGVIDFDAVLRDPSHPARLLPEYDSGDHIHPCDAGYRAMANAIDLGVLA
jgi:lysophospholipase L1-like esterase